MVRNSIRRPTDTATGFKPISVADLRLGGAQELGGVGLCHAALFEQAMNLQGELGFQQLLSGIGQAKVGEDAAAALFNCFGHFICSFVRPAWSSCASFSLSRIIFILAIKKPLMQSLLEI